MDKDRLRELSRKKIKKEVSKMMRKLTVISLVVGLCLMGVTPVLAQKSYSTLAEYEELTGNKIESFNEAPILSAMVAAGEIPPVEERLPEEPMVVEPLEQIGRYGGTLITGSEKAAFSPDMSRTRTQNLFRLSPVDFTFIPNIAKGWDLSKDYKALTVYLRKGMKWSDGAPFTADDILFWYNDILLNDELTPVKPKVFSPGGELVKVEKLNDYAVRFQFAAPYPIIINLFSYFPWFQGVQVFYPKHYLKKWHIKYNPKADEIAKEEGYDHWYQSFGFHREVKKQGDVNLPTLDPWAMEEIDSYGNRYSKRNPYFFKVDTAGNQLPYIDEQVSKYASSLEVLELKTIAGEYSFIGRTTSLKNYPLYMENEEKGGYRVILAKQPQNPLGITFNLNHKDPVKRKIFGDIRFKQAMSLAINREEISNSLFYGKATPFQATTGPEASFYEDWMGKYYVEYDPKRANELLDEMGLKRGKDGYRMRPDGETLNIIVEFAPAEPIIINIWELIEEYWEKVGVKIALKQVRSDLFHTRFNANELDLGSWALDMPEIRLHRDTTLLRPPFLKSCPMWRDWYDSGGKTGEEPPEEIKELFKLCEDFQTFPSGTEEYMRIGKELLTRNLEGLYTIGTVVNAPRPLLIDANLRNTPKEGYIFNWNYSSWGLYEVSQWFFEK